MRGVVAPVPLVDADWIVIGPEQKPVGTWKTCKFGVVPLVDPPETVESPGRTPSIVKLKNPVTPESSAFLQISTVLVIAKRFVNVILV